MGNDSGELGHNLMDHHFQIGASGNTMAFKTNTTLVKGQTEYTFLNLEILEAIQIEKISLEDMVIKEVEVEEIGPNKCRAFLWQRFKRSYFKTRWMDNGIDWFW